MTEKITKLALASRVIVIALQLIANGMLPDHKPDVFRSPQASPSNISTTYEATALDKVVQHALGGLRHWDGEYFLHIAEHGYSYENTLAFFPLFPMAVRYVGRTLHYISCDCLSLSSSMLLAAVLLNTLLFCNAANTLYALTARIFNDANKSWNAGLLFCFNPASIFFTAAYSETLYCWLSLHVMLECVSGLRFLRYTLPLAMSMVTRSNGVINAGFAVYFLLRKTILHPAYRCMWTVLQLLASLLLALMPQTFFYFHAFHQFCQSDLIVPHADFIMSYARERNYVLAGHRQAQNSPWCDLTVPYHYSYIQSNYWNVGFLRYYEWRQLPNFMLAMPIIGFMLFHCGWCLRHSIRVLYPKFGFVPLIKEFKSLAFVLHALFLTLTCCFFVHIQVTTRMLCSATPCLYWFGADYFPKSLEHIRLRSKPGAILLWFAIYFLAGSILFSNNFPWT